MEQLNRRSRIPGLGKCRVQLASVSASAQTEQRGPQTERLPSGLLEPIIIEPKGSGILRHVADELVRGTLGKVRLDVECDLNVGPDDAR